MLPKIKSSSNFIRFFHTNLILSKVNQFLLLYVETDFGKIKDVNFSASLNLYGKITTHFIFILLTLEKFKAQEKLGIP